MRNKKKKRYKWRDYTLDEKFTVISLILGIFFLTQHYILAYIGRDPMQTLAEVIVTGLIVVLVKYAIKSFKGKREEENMKFKREKAGLEEIFDDEENEDLWNG